jgi:2-amino-4-hydroxy-6-hydroxymethyldihydropteridine diphosphokinase
MYFLPVSSAIVFTQTCPIYHVDARKANRVSYNALAPWYHDPVNTVCVYIGLGSNLGDRKANLSEAVRLLGELGSVVRQSNIMETEPWGYTDQPMFLNMAVALETGLAPLELLKATQRIEKQMGREPSVQWGPRLIDIDMLMYGDIHLNTPELTLPHPRMAERDFVMIPLGEIEAQDSGFRIQATSRIPDPESRTPEVQ